MWRHFPSKMKFNEKDLISGYDIFVSFFIFLTLRTVVHLSWYSNYMLCSEFLPLNENSNTLHNIQWLISLICQSATILMMYSIRASCMYLYRDIRVCNFRIELDCLYESLKVVGAVQSFYIYDFFLPIDVLHIIIYSIVMLTIRRCREVNFWFSFRY